MKLKNILILFILATLSSSMNAEELSKQNFNLNTLSINESIKKSNDTNLPRRISFGILVQTDIGGAIPVPFKYIPKQFNPYPQLNIALGILGEIKLKNGWSLGANLSYKTVGMKADSRVSNQKFNDVENGLLQYFTGTASMEMSFTMLEVPIYAKYTFKNKVSKVLFGTFFSYNLKTKFRVNASKGYAGDRPNFAGIIVEEGGEPLVMNFSSSLRNFDVGIMVGYEHNIFKNFDVGLRLSCGLFDIFQKGVDFFDYKMLNMRGSVVLSYILFD